MSSTPEINGHGNEFKRRVGTAGISGHLYETKLLSLLYFRAIHAETIKEFQLASNVDDIGSFDDICLKVTVRELDKPVCLFIQAKHRENKKKTLKIDWAPYFISYLNIRQHFNPNKNDMFFGHAFDKTECYFVIYTTAKDGFSNELKAQSSLCSSLHDLINTGGTAKQPYKNNEEDFEFLCEIAIKENMTSLAKTIAESVMGKKKINMAHEHIDELMIRYHVILQQKVFNVSEIQSSSSEEYRIATFRQAFLNSNEEYLSVFKDTLYEEILKKRKIKKTDVNSLLSEFLADTSNAEKLSKLIVTVITTSDQYDVYVNKKYAEIIDPLQLNEVKVTPYLVKQAIKLAADEILLSPQLELRVPATFGNEDIKIRNYDRIKDLTSLILSLLDDCKCTKFVTIDDSLPYGLQKLNGGIASAIGNLFVLDDKMKWMKITSDQESLGPNAKTLYQNLKEEIERKNDGRSLINKIPDMNEFRFNFTFKWCPKLLLQRSEYEKHLVRDFLSKLLMYSGQDDEKGVENKLIDEIDENLGLNDFLRQTSKSFFLKYHNDIQTWWKIPKKAPYLNKSSQILNKLNNNISLDPLLSSISEPYIEKLERYDYSFTEDAVRSLKLSDHSIIVTENCELTVIKVLQHLKDKKHVLIDFEDIVNLPKKERNAIRRELANTENDLIFVFNIIPEKEKRTFINIAEAVANKTTILITKPSFRDILQEYFRTADYNIVKDDSISLVDMNEDTEMNILERGTVRIQGLELRLEDLTKGWNGFNLDSPME